MKKDEVITTYICDLCGQKVEKNKLVEAGAQYSFIVSKIVFSFDHTYNPLTIEDICEECHNTLMGFLKKTYPRLQERK